MSKRHRSSPTRKPRVIEIGVDFGKDMTITGMSPPGVEPMQFLGVDGKPVIPAYIEIGQGYQRSKGDLKVVHRAIADPNAIHRDPTSALMRFATILAVDTNTRAIEGRRVSVTAAVAILNLHWKVLVPQRWEASVADQEPYEFHDATISPELVGWERILECARFTPVPTPAVLIVDSELDRLREFNQRTKQIVPGFDLPAGFELMYASGERDRSQFVGNAAVAYCDQLASKILDRIETDPAARAWLPNAPAPRWTRWHGRWVKSR
jgi:hypothetical protein